MVSAALRLCPSLTRGVLKESPEPSRTLPQVVLSAIVIDGYPACADRQSYVTLQGECLRIDDVGLNSEAGETSLWRRPDCAGQPVTDGSRSGG